MKTYSLLLLLAVLPSYGAVIDCQVSTSSPLSHKLLANWTLNSEVKEKSFGRLDYKVEMPNSFYKAVRFVCEFPLAGVVKNRIQCSASEIEWKEGGEGQYLHSIAESNNPLPQGSDTSSLLVNLAKDEDNGQVQLECASAK